MSQRPRFLLTFLSWAGGLSGGDRHLLEVAGRWSEHVDLAVVCPPRALSTIHSFVGEVPASRLGLTGGRLGGLGPLLALEYVRRALTVAVRQLPRADVVAAASHFIPDATGVATLARRGALGVAYVYHLIAERRVVSPRTLWSKADERLALALLRRSARVVFVSNQPTAAALAARGFDPVRTAVGVDLASFRPTAAASLPPRAAFVGRMVHTKGVIDAVETWARVRKAVPEAKLVMVGIGPERERAAARAAELGISDAVEWRGFVSEEEKRLILSESRLLLAPSYEEGWGISVCEAFATAVPVAGYQLPVLDELFGSAYLAAAPGDIAGLADLAVRVLTDDRLADLHGSRGRKAAGRYDVSVVAEQELQTILAACAS